MIAKYLKTASMAAHNKTYAGFMALLPGACLRVVCLIPLLMLWRTLMAGGTVKGMAWVEGVPFIDTVIATRGYWTWRAVGGTLMYVSHFIFAWNFYTMVRQPRPVVQATINEPIPA